MAKYKTPQLRKQVHKLFGDGQVYDDGYQSCYDGKWIDMTDEVCAVADFIIADRKRVALEARIDAAEHILNTMVHEAGGYCDEIDPNDITNYIAELKAQQEAIAVLP